MITERIQIVTANVKQYESMRLIIYSYNIIFNIQTCVYDKFQSRETKMKVNGEKQQILLFLADII
jgi:hypothetical protein